MTQPLLAPGDRFSPDPRQTPAGEPEPGRRLRLAVAAAVESWRRRQPRPDPAAAPRLALHPAMPATPAIPAIPRSEAGPPGTTVLAPIPRPRRLGVRRDGAVSPPRRQDEVFKAGFFFSLTRLAVWIFVGLRFSLAVLGDWLRRRSTQQLRARRLRRALESGGTAFIKVGQQLAMRIDLVPQAYAAELEKMLDNVGPIPLPYALREIERAAGKPLGEVFLRIDPEPIGSASIACVYQGIRTTGERVVLKVRRPGIGKTLAADMRALGWALRFLELFLLPPGFSRHLVYELSSMLLEELDFVKEARYTEIFRRRARKAKMRFVSVPRVHFDLCGRTVLATELVSGVWLNDLLSAVEHHDEEALEAVRAQRIDPRLVASRLLQVARYGGFEGLFFHADLHPANILVQPDSHLVLIDFGSCGAFTEKERQTWRRLLQAQESGDIGHMVEASLALLEPLPSIDIDEITKRLEAVFWQDLYAFKSKHSEWWERTSASIWINFLKLAREYRIPMNLNTVRMIRVSLLADTLAARLAPGIDHYREYRRYEKAAGKRARKRLYRKLRRNLGIRTYVRLEQGFELASTFFYRIQRIFDSPLLRFASRQSLAAFAVSLFLRLSVSLGLLTSLTATVLALGEKDAAPLPLPDLAEKVLSNRVYLVLVLLLLVTTLRRLLFRSYDREL